ncbi:hypothetical protein [Streptomyces sp. NPDC088789]|uniref:hypothetical protein n=1 Tax=Streptomyces sp. NPDC088789 TaxID=3365899 RepID=UPI00382E88EE
MSELASKLKEDPIVAARITDPADQKAIGGTRRVTGFVGRSETPGYWRVYLSTRLDDYVEIREEDIVQSYSLPTSEHSPQGGTVVVVRDDARLLRTHDIDMKQLGLRAQIEFLRASQPSADGKGADDAGFSASEMADAQALLLGGRVNGEIGRRLASDGLTGIFCSVTMTVALEC